MAIKPGIYKDLPNKTYHADTALSHSGMEKLAKTASHFKDYIDNPIRSTAAFLFGSPFHCKALQPNIFDDIFRFWPKGYRRKKDEILDVEINGQEWVKEVDLIEIDNMIDALNAHPIASALLSGGELEVSYFWKHEIGFMGKVRPDCKKLDVLIDLKSCIDASPIGFGKASANFGYIRQASWYMDGVAACGVSVEQFVFIAVEKKPPYAVAVYIVDDEDLMDAHEENEALAVKYGECLNADKWPGYSENIEVLHLPPYHKPLII